MTLDVVLERGSGLSIHRYRLDLLRVIFSKLGDNFVVVL
jgi:hypothetical protein